MPRARAAALPQGLRAFQRVLIQDSTLIALCAALAKIFPGSRNQCGTTHGQLRIQALYDLLTQRFLSFGLSGFTRNDQAAAYDILPALQAGDLGGDFFLQLCLEAWQIRITEALLFQLEYHGRYERRARKNFVQKLMN